MCFAFRHVSARAGEGVGVYLGAPGRLCASFEALLQHSSTPLRLSCGMTAAVSWQQCQSRLAAGEYLSYYTIARQQSRPAVDRQVSPALSSRLAHWQYSSAVSAAPPMFWSRRVLYVSLAS